MENKDQNDVISKLLDCVVVCEACSEAFLQQDNIKTMVECIKLTRDCAYICTLVASLLQRDSVIAHQHVELCEDICRLCAGECAKHQQDYCQQCAIACWVCADACHDYHQLVIQYI